MSPMNLLVVCVYWTILREKVVAESCNTPVTYLHTTLSHSLPLIFNIITFSKTDIIVKSSHGLILPVIGLLYGVHNYSATIRQGAPVYPFLPWTDLWTPIIIALLTLACMGAFSTLASLTKTIKRGGFSTKSLAKDA